MQSMTGFGRAEGKIGNSRFTIEVKSVNHRYLDARFRLPPALSAYELPLLEKLRAKCERGSFEISVRQKLAAEKETVTTGSRMAVDENAAESLMQACEWLHKKYKTERIPSLEALALTNRVFVAVEDSQDQEALGEQLNALFEFTLEELNQSRHAEGQRMEAILKSGLETLGTVLAGLQKVAPQQPIKILEKLNQRIGKWNLTQPVDSQRLEWEVAFYAERSDITEELDRLKAHIEEFSILLKSKKAVGRRLDFLTQELHREVNTMASKASLLELTQLTLEAKGAIEKLREQVQNVE